MQEYFHTQENEIEVVMVEQNSCNRVVSSIVLISTPSVSSEKNQVNIKATPSKRHKIE